MSRQLATQRAEESVIGALMRSADVRLEILSAGLEPEHFHFRPYRMAYEEIIERFYADDAIDPLTVAEAVGPAAANAWKIDEHVAIDKLTALAQYNPDDQTATIEHAKIIKRHADYRELVKIATGATNNALAQEIAPDEIAGALSAAATRIVTGAMARGELLGYADLGRRWLRTMNEEIAAREAGTEVGARFQIAGIDEFVKGLRPSELMMLGGEPGVGKSACAWAMARNFAYRQMRRPPEKRVGTLVLSLEMGEHPSSSRFAQLESRVQGERLREASLTRAELRVIAARWAQNRELPLYVNHSGELRESQVRALCVDAIRRHNVGLVVIDHFRFIKPDERFENRNDADEEVVKFLKATLAKDLNLAVVCLAHTTKHEHRRPVMDDLRGSKMISAFADVVTFLFSPWRYASESDRRLMAREQFEAIHDKVRQSAGGVGEIWIDMSTMTIR
jgi:replicative DNA helicase